MPDQKRRRGRDESDERVEGGTTVRRRGPGRDDHPGDRPDADERPSRKRARRPGREDDGGQQRGPRGREDDGRQQRGSRGPEDRSRDGGRPRRRARDRGPTGAQLAQRARRELAEITGLDTESVTSLAQADDGTWQVTVEALELARVPESDDVLGSYEVQLDEDGELLGYERVERYARSQSGRRDRRGS